MKQLTKPISDFILASNLENQVKGVCFNAAVFFTSDKLVIQIESKIAIILKGFPDMFASEKWGLLSKKIRG